MEFRQLLCSRRYCPANIPQVIIAQFLLSLPCRTQLTHCQSQSHVTPDGQSASLSWNKAPIWGLRQDFYYCQTVAGLLMWVALSDERTGVSFTIAAGPRQRSNSRVRVRWDSRPYFLRWRYSTPPPHGRADS
jgi:hypothetical protein